MYPNSPHPSISFGQIDTKKEFQTLGYFAKPPKYADHPLAQLTESTDLRHLEAAPLGSESIIPDTDLISNIGS